MWDIKLKSELEMQLDERFHLNHVGYKESVTSGKHYKIWVFHLNHVGYKATDIPTK